MTEEEARAWAQAKFDVPRETMERLDAFATLLLAENERQNLISRSGDPKIWTRHIADSAQLLLLVPKQPRSWIDLGSGAGFPGLVAALFGSAPVTLVEERRLRVEFLHRAVELLGLCGRVTIVGSRLERIPASAFDVISARAFAPLPRLFELATRFATERTIWVLPKGRNAKSELEAVRGSWQGEFRVEPSLTDPDAFIIVAHGVSRQSEGSRLR